MARRSSASPPEPFLFDDQLPEDLPVPELTENARIVLGKRYLKKDEHGEPVEEPEVMFWRVAYTIAKEDARYGASEAAVEEVAVASLPQQALAHILIVRLISSESTTQPTPNR